MTTKIILQLIVKSQFFVLIKRARIFKDIEAFYSSVDYTAWHTLLKTNIRMNCGLSLLIKFPKIHYNVSTALRLKVKIYQRGCKYIDIFHLTFPAICCVSTRVNLMSRGEVNQRVSAHIFNWCFSTLVCVLSSS